MTLDLNDDMWGKRSEEECNWMIGSNDTNGTLDRVEALRLAGVCTVVLVLSCGSVNSFRRIPANQLPPESVGLVRTLVKWCEPKVVMGGFVGDVKGKRIRLSLEYMYPRIVVERHCILRSIS